LYKEVRGIINGYEKRWEIISTKRERG
jgi:hypothetical protein